jgi:hypothetical protein
MTFPSEEMIETMLQMHRDLEGVIQKYQSKLPAGQLAANLAGMLSPIAHLSGMPEERFIAFMRDIYTVNPDQEEENIQ